MKKEENQELNIPEGLSQIFSFYPEIKLDDIHIQIASYEKLTRKGLPYFYNIDHLAKKIGITSGELWFLVRNKNKVYKTYKVEKKNKGLRTISAPSKQLKFVQRWILENILYKNEMGPSVHGFIPGRSIVSNAEPHVNRDLVLGLDIKNFFPSVTLPRVRGLFSSFGYNEEIAWGLAELATFEFKLPQGAPTSPMIANLITRNMDLEFEKYCRKRLLSYTRYADDISISGGRKLPLYVNDITQIINDEGFEINSDKTRIVGKGSCQKVTGIVVNDKLNLNKKKRKKLRAVINNCIKQGPIKANCYNIPYFKEWLNGELAFAMMVNKEKMKPMLELFRQIDWTEYDEWVKSLNADEAIQRRIKKATISIPVKFDEMGFFMNVGQIPDSQPREEILKRLDILLERCKKHKVKECSDCLKKKDEENHICMKFIIGHFTGSTSGHHHGHEIFDMGAYTNLNDENVHVAFILKAQTDRNSINSAFVQFVKVIIKEGYDVVTIATPKNFGHDLESLVILQVKELEKAGNDKRYCLIQRDEMERILYEFAKKYPELYPYIKSDVQ